MYCIKCGNKIDEDSAFCSQCGAKAGVVPKTETVKIAETEKTSGKLSKKVIVIGGIVIVVTVIVATALFLYGISRDKGVREEVEVAVDMEKGHAKSDNNFIKHRTGDDEYMVEVFIYSAENVVVAEERDTKSNMLTGAVVMVREGAMNSTGDILTTEKSDDLGRVCLNLKSGVYTLQIDVQGYETAYMELDVNEQGVSKDVCLIPSIDSEKTTVLPAWGRNKELVVTEDVLEKYREFLSGNITVDYHGGQITYNELVCDIYGEYCEYDMEGENQPRQRFTLTDSNQDNIPELIVDLFDLSNDGGVYIIELIENQLGIIGENVYGYMDSLTVYKRGIFRYDHGLSASAYPIWFKSMEDKPLATFEIVYSEFSRELTEATVTEDYERWYNEGYEYVYVTSDDVCSWEDFDALVDDYAVLNWGEETEFYEVEESSIQNNMRWCE